MRAVALHADVIVFVSDVWQTTSTALRAGDEGFVIDSPVYPEELKAVPEVLEQAGFPVSGLLATHGDWDHLLGRLAFPDASLGCAESTAARLAAEPGQAQRSLRSFDAEHYVEGRGPLALGGVQRAAGAGPARARQQPGARAAPDRRPHGRRSGVPDAVDGGARVRGLPVTGRDPDDLGRRIARGYVETLERLAQLLDRPRRSCRGTGHRSEPRTLGGCWRRTSPTWRPCGPPAPRPRFRRVVPRAAQQQIHTENLSRL